MADPDTAAAPGFRISRTELVWPGKYDERGQLVDTPRVSLPFQVVEVIQEGRSPRELIGSTNLPLFGERPTRLGDGWRNKLIWGDNLYVLGSLAEYTEKVDLIYIDPPSILAPTSRSR